MGACHSSPLTKRHRDSIVATITSAMYPTSSPSSSTITYLPPPQRVAGKNKLHAIHYTTLQSLAHQSKITLPSGKTIYVPHKATTLWMLDHVIKPACTAGLSFADLLPSSAVSHKECEGLYVCHSLCMDFRELVDGLEPFVPTNSPYVWLDIFQLDQLSVSALREWQTQSHDTLIRFSYRLVFLDSYDNPSALQKTWTVWELIAIAQSEQSATNRTYTTHFTLPNSETSRFCDRVLLRDPDRVLEILDHLDIARAHALLPSDQDMIFHKVDTTVGIAAVNAFVLDRLRKWFVQAGMTILESTRKQQFRDYEREVMLLRCISNLHRNSGSFEPAYELLAEALQVAELKFGRNTLAWAQLQGDLGCALSEQGSYREAKTALQQCLDVYINLMGATSTWVADIEMAAAYNLRAASEFTEALQMYEHALAVFRTAEGGDHASLTRALDGVASCSLELGDFKRAAECEEEIVSKMRNADDHHTSTAALLAQHDNDDEDNVPVSSTTTTTNLGKVLHLVEALNDQATCIDLTGDETQAKAIRNEVINRCEQALEHLPQDQQGTMDHATLCVRLGEALCASNQRFERALSLFETANAIHGRVLGQEHALVLAVLTAQARCHEQLYQFDRSLAIHLRDLDLAMSSPLGDANPGVAAAMSNISYCYGKKSDFTKAKEWGQRSLDLRRKHMPGSPVMAFALTELGWILFELAEYEDALKLHTEATQVRMAALGKEHPDVASDYDAVAENLEKLHKFEEAIAARNIAISMRERLFGYFHPETIGTRADLAHTYEVSGDLDTAMEMVHGILRDRTLHLGARHAHTARSHRNLGRLFKCKGEYEQAEIKLKEAIEIFDSIARREPDPPATETRELLGETLALAKRYEDAEVIFRRVVADFTVFCGSEKHHSVAFAKHKLAMVIRDSAVAVSAQGNDDDVKNRIQEAESLGKEAMQVLLQSRGSKHEDSMAAVKAWGGGGGNG